MQACIPFTTVQRQMLLSACGLNDATGHEVVGKKVPMIPTVQQTTEELEDNNFMPSQLCLVHVYPLLNYFMFWR